MGAPKRAHLALGVIEVGGDGDDGAIDLAALTHEGLRDVAHLAQDHAADLLGREPLLLALEGDCARRGRCYDIALPVCSRSSSPSECACAVCLAQIWDAEGLPHQGACFGILLSSLVKPA